jgi:YegS/Rv2252/BmrU family lipid kinase
VSSKAKGGGTLAVIYHPVKVNLARLKKSVDAHSRKAGFAKVLWLPTESAEPESLQAEAALAQGATRVLVAGGDGTIRPIIDVLRGTGIAFGIVPVGTGNVLARNLRLPLNSLDKAVELALTGSARAIDVGRVTYDAAGSGRETLSFAVMAGLGLDAKIMMNTDLKLKRRLGWIAYIDGGFKSLPARRQRLEVTVDGSTHRSLKVQSLLIGNCGFLPGNINLMPAAKLDDGLLDVAVVGPRLITDWAIFWSRVTWQNALFWRNHATRKFMVTTTPVTILENLAGRAIVVEPEQPIALQLDGDALRNVTRAEFVVLPGALQVVC